MQVCSLFSGIGGFESGLATVGFETTLFCEVDPLARRVLQSRFPGIPISEDIRSLKALPRCDMIVAGWPCQDLSQAGKTAGLTGSKSSLVNEVFRLIDRTKWKPEFVLLENVVFSLFLHGGAAVDHVVSELERRGYNWCYRILDSINFGLPHRRRRIFILASRSYDPTAILLESSVGPSSAESKCSKAFGFYWTEGNRGLGWTPEAIPPLKPGSGLAIPSAPAVWLSDSAEFVSPGLLDAERLQGFPDGWTEAANQKHGGTRVRWRLLGNAVSVPVTRWIGSRITQAGAANHGDFPIVEGKTAQHNIARGGPGKPKQLGRVLTEGPAQPIVLRLSDFGLKDAQSLSKRAASGFLKRLLASTLKRSPEFEWDLRAYVSAKSADTSCLEHSDLQLAGSASCTP
jgi:DNA (cytosine-5)-methyltransferase 1